MSAYGRLYRSVLYPLHECVRGGSALKMFNEMERLQWLPEDEIRRVQWSRFKKLLDHAYAYNGFYRKRFDEAGITPENIRTAQDLLQIPAVTKQDLQEHQDSWISREQKNGLLRDRTTSGSTGECLRFAYNRLTHESRIASTARYNRWIGGDFGERELHVWSVANAGVAPWKRAVENIHHFLTRRWIFNAFALSAEGIRKCIDRINALRPRLLVGYSVTLSEIAKFINENGVRCFPPGAIVSTAEVLESLQRKEIERAFSAKVYNRYGARELGFIASECERREGLHINADNLLVEVLKEGKPAEPGESGELVITDLTNFAAPFIRYKNEDLAVFSGNKCSCGRGLPLLDRIQGRKNDGLVLPDGKRVYGSCNALIAGIHGINKIQVVQDSLRHLTIRIVKSAAFQENQCKEIVKRVRCYYDPRFEVCFEFPKEIRTTASGKYRCFVSLVSPEETFPGP